jgi:hypothetical protein
MLMHLSISPAVKVKSAGEFRVDFQRQVKVMNSQYGLRHPAGG